MVLMGCSGRRELRFEGKTMGTIYHIKVVAGYWTRTGPIQTVIDDTLEAVNASMSTYRPESEISRFNRFREAGRAFEIGAGFFEVMNTAHQLHRLTEGAWDGTVDPLIELWGFGRDQKPPAVPASEDIQAAMGRVGFDRIDIAPPDTLIKRSADVSLNLSSIAKGYGVDAVAREIRALGFSDFLVEIGGEVMASGVRPDGSPWRVGINLPRTDAGFEEVYKVIALTDRAFATSGDYRNYFVLDGRRYSHIIDPRTGYPVASGIVSASVAAPTCTLADGLATALVVMGAEAGMALVNRLDGVEGYIIVETADGRLVDHFSSGFEIEATGSQDAGKRQDRQ
jgi:thiamine biosynthesis lipoprotein